MLKKHQSRGCMYGHDFWQDFSAPMSPHEFISKSVWLARRRINSICVHDTEPTRGEGIKNGIYSWTCFIHFYYFYYNSWLHFNYMPCMHASSVISSKPHHCWTWVILRGGKDMLTWTIELHAATILARKAKKYILYTLHPCVYYIFPKLKTWNISVH